MNNYKEIFNGVESTLFDIGARKLSRDQIRAELEPFKHFQGRRLTDDEYYTKLVHIIFYSGFRAATVTEKLPIIDRHFPNYKTVAEYSDGAIRAILGDTQMIRNRLKIEACVENAKTFRTIILEWGTFQKFVDSLAPMLSDGDIIALRDKFSELFRFLGDRTAFHFMMGIGLPVLKPDRVIERIFKRLAIVDQGLEGDALYAALIRAGQRFAEATGYPIRYIDIIFVAYGQVQTDELGLERGICLKEPLCSICGVTKYCDYYAQRRNPL